jgi:penicillin-binding protein 2
VGVEPRRNPEIVVCTLLEEGEHGYLAARTAAKVIKAFVDKQRRTPPKMADQPQPKNGGKVEISGVWTVPDSDEGKDRLQGGRFAIDLASKPPVLATAAPGVN